MKKQIIVLICMVLICAIGVSLVSCSKDDSKQYTEKLVTSSADDTSVDENGATVVQDSNNAAADSEAVATTKKGEKTTAKQGNKVPEAEVVEESTTDKKKDDKKRKNKKESTTATKDETTKKETTTKKKNEKTTTTTTTTLPYTTTKKASPLDPIISPEEPIDDIHVLTDSSAMYYLNERYDLDVYVVNLISATEDVATFRVYVLADASVYSNITVNLVTGVAKEVIKQTNETQTFNLV